MQTYSEHTRQLLAEQYGIPKKRDEVLKTWDELAGEANKAYLGQHYIDEEGFPVTHFHQPLTGEALRAITNRYVANTQKSAPGLSKPVNLASQLGKWTASGAHVSWAGDDGRRYSVRLAPEKEEEEGQGVAAQLLEDLMVLGPASFPDWHPGPGKMMLEISITDMHFGKLAYASQVGQDNSLAYAEDLYLRAVTMACQKARNEPVERVLLVVGNDLFHVDGAAKKTTAGTFVDSELPATMLFDRVVKIIVRSVHTIRSTFPNASIRLVYVPGNHDHTISAFCMTALHCYFQNVSGVEVDRQKSSRTYEKYGRNLIGFDHGDRLKSPRLHGTMVDEMGQAYVDAVVREWHLGHFHRSKVQTQIQSAGDAVPGLVVRYLPSLTATDAWHYQHGFIGMGEAHVFLWKESGGLHAIYPIYMHDLQD